jgi:hypothetical protein
MLSIELKVLSTGMSRAKAMATRASMWVAFAARSPPRFVHTHTTPPTRSTRRSPRALKVCGP